MLSELDALVLDEMLRFPEGVDGRELSLDELRATGTKELARIVAAAEERDGPGGTDVLLRGYDLGAFGALVNPNWGPEGVTDADREKVGAVIGEFVAASLARGDMACDEARNDLMRGACALQEMKRNLYGTPAMDAVTRGFDGVVLDPATPGRENLSELSEAVHNAYFMDVCRSLGQGEGMAGLDGGYDVRTFDAPDAYWSDLTRRDRALARWLPLVDDEMYQTWAEMDTPPMSEFHELREELCQRVALAAVPARGGSESPVSAVTRGDEAKGLVGPLMRADRDVLAKVRGRYATIRAERDARESGARPVVNVVYRAGDGAERHGAFWTEAATRMYVEETISPDVDLSAAKPRWRGDRDLIQSLQAFSRERRGLPPASPKAGPAKASGAVARAMSAAESATSAGLGNDGRQMGGE